MSEFPLQPGARVTRSELNEQFGGGIQGGMLTPANKPLIFLFSDTESGKRFGYDTDGWKDETRTRYLYTGEGAVGHQYVDRRKNKALLDSIHTGKEVHLFIAVGRVQGRHAKVHEYLGRFEVDPDDPWQPVTTLDQNQEPRTAVLFNLDRVDIDSSQSVPAGPVVHQPDRTPRCTLIEGEAANTLVSERKAVDPVTVERRERRFEDRLIAWLQQEGFPTGRLRLNIGGELGPLFTDTWISTTGTLIEAKADATRNDIRMAVSQLLDYRRHIDPPPQKCVVVVPILPSEDLRAFVTACGLNLAVFDDSGWNEVAHP